MEFLIINDREINILELVIVTNLNVIETYVDVKIVQSQTIIALLHLF